MLNHPNSQPPPAPAPSSDRSGRDYSLPTTRYSLLLISYFRSGWAFLIPYLAAYLLYAWLKWPVNPAGVVNSQLSALSSQPSSLLPPLLHVYWFLHAVHLLLGSLALRTWWRNSTVHSPPFSVLWRVAPWLCLALLFWIPGVYWEFPGDVWEHYTRINDYSVYADVRSIGTWRKSTYFLAYSFVGQLPAVRQFFWLNLYYVSMCLLLCWQYFRLAREIGLKHEAAIIFVLLQGLLLGNSVFSFYRYYGLSSTTPGHLCALALICLVLRTIKARRQGRLEQGLARYNFSVGGCTLLLMLQMAFSHPQALGLALLGLIAVSLWQIGEWKRPALLWIAFGVALASAAIVWWWPVSPVLRDIYRSAGWMTQWYGFNLLSPDSPAGQRSLQILGMFGLINLAVGAWLLRRNHLAGWLTMTPVFALLCPLFAIPFATLLSKTSPEYIVVFSRMLLGIPVGLALIFCFQEIMPKFFPSTDLDFRTRVFSPFLVLLCSVATLLTIPANAPYNNRFWQALMRPPADLTMDQAVVIFSRPEIARIKASEAPRFVTTDGFGFIAHSTGIRNVTFNDRVISFPLLRPPSLAADERFIFLTVQQSRNITFFLPSPFELYSARSIAGYLSGHWFPQGVALQYATRSESAALALHLGAKRAAPANDIYYYLGR